MKRARSNCFRPLSAVALIVGLISLAACSSAVSSARLSQVTPGMKADQVTNLLGPPERIEHAEITGVVGDVYYYAGRPGTAKVVLINGLVFSTQLEPGDRA